MGQQLLQRWPARSQKSIKLLLLKTWKMTTAKKTPLKIFKSRRNSARRPITLRYISGTAHPAGFGLAIAVKIFSTFQLLNVDYGYEKTCLTVVP